MLPSFDCLTQLIALVYAAAHDDRGWEPFLAALSDATGAQSAVLISHNLNRVGSVSAAGRLDPEMMGAYNRHFHAHDPFALSLRARPTAERSGVYVGESLVPRSALLRSEFGHDFAEAFDLTRMMTAIVQGASNDQSVPVTGVTVMRRARDWSFSEHDRLLFESVFPHLVRALAIRRRLRTVELTERTLGSVFELLPTPAMVVDRRGRVLRANRRAEQLLTRADSLAIQQGVLTAHTSGDTSRLHAACAAAALPQAADAQAGATLTIARPLSVTPLRLIVAPLPREEEPSSMDTDRATALVLVDEPDAGRAPSVAVLRGLYGLTMAEAEIAAGIGMGKGLDEIAATRKCSLQTVRWHNKRILNKMGCGSRRELVRQLTTSLASLLARD